MTGDEPPKDDGKRRWKPSAKDKHDGARSLHEKVSPKKARTQQQRAWLERQLNDPYVKRAQAAGYRARSVFKLIELDEQLGILKKGARVVDLGAAPGSWCQVALKIGAARVVGIDLLPIDPIAGVTLIEGDFLDEAMQARVLEELGGAPDIVLSDMAANTTGHAKTDQIRTGVLAEEAARFAMDHLAAGGVFVTKAFQGGLDAALLGELKQAFASVKHAKPKASRAESVEIYLVAKGFRGR
jgi:23S rRNA (uridine2552-2'-O)-methyltransferase